MKAFSVDEVTASSKLMTAYRKTNIAIENIIKYRVTFPSNYPCQIRITVQERPGILVTTHVFLFLRHHNKIKLLWKKKYLKRFKLLTPGHSYAM